jgi:hypothetical protein
MGAVDQHAEPGQVSAFKRFYALKHAGAFLNNMLCSAAQDVGQSGRVSLKFLDTHVAQCLDIR